MVKYHREQKNVITMICAYKNISIPIASDTKGISLYSYWVINKNKTANVAKNNVGMMTKKRKR